MLRATRCAFALIQHWRTRRLQGYAADFKSTAALSQRALELCERHHLQRELGTSQWIQGRAQVARGETAAGLALMQQGRLHQLAQGRVFGLTRWHEWFAQACMAAGRLDEAAAAVQDDLALAERTGEHSASAALHGLLEQLPGPRGARHPLKDSDKPLA